MATVLIAMNDVVGRVEIQNRLGRRFLERGNELFDEDTAEETFARFSKPFLRLPKGEAQGGAGYGGGIAL